MQSVLTAGPVSTASWHHHWRRRAHDVFLIRLAEEFVVLQTVALHETLFGGAKPPLVTTLLQGIHRNSTPQPSAVTVMVVSSG